MAYIVLAYIVMAFKVMADVVMAYAVMAHRQRRLPRVDEAETTFSVFYKHVYMSVHNSLNMLMRMSYTAVCTRMAIYTCLCIHAYTHMRIHTGLCTHAHVHACTPAYKLDTCLPTRVYTCVCTHVDAHVSAGRII